MKVVNLLSLHEKFLKLMSDHGIKPSDVNYVGLYHDYVTMRNQGEKYWTCLFVLSDKYNISERTVSRLICRLSKDVSL